ncbi:oligosaccharide flippase family protein [Enterococcus sp. C76]|uniref:oligosaccharide flippase family protein n=1 Tax=Enterococcus sp. C76 TaxID=3231334 RepID=UPI00349FDBFD
MTRIRKGIILSYFTVIVKNISMLVFTQLLLRSFSKNDYGLYQLANSIISNLSLLNLGFSSAYIKFFTVFSTKKEKIKLNKLNGTYVLMFLVISLFAIFCGIILLCNSSYFLASFSVAEENRLKKMMFLMMLNVILTFIGTPFEANILANEQFIFQQNRQIFQFVSLPILTFIFIYFFHVNVEFIIVIQTIINFISLFANFYFCIKKISMNFIFKNLEFSFIKEITCFSFFIFLNQLFNQINDNAPIFILGKSMGTSEVAVYSIVNQLKALFLTFSQVLTTIFIPKVNRLVHLSDNSELLVQLMIKIGRYQLLLIGFFLGGFIILGKYFLYLWLGEGFEKAYYLLISIMIPLLIPLSQNIAIEIQQARNKHFFRSIVLTIFSFLNIVITFFSVEIVGIEGATVGYIFILIFGYGIVMNYYYQKKMELNMKKFWFAVIPSLIPFTVIIALNNFVGKWIQVQTSFSFLVVGSIYCIVYVFLVFLFIPSSFQNLNLIKGKRE